MLSIIGNIGSCIGGLAGVIALIITLKTYKNNVERERIRATLSDFQNIRIRYRGINKYSEKEEIKDYLAALDNFAVGVNNDAYDIKIVNTMSGALLQSQFKYLKEYISAHQKNENTYGEYLKMMDVLDKLRGQDGKRGRL